MLRNSLVAKCTSLSVAYGRRELSIMKKNVTVLQSNSNCIFENLALEDYIYENASFKDNQRIFLLWRNKPCVVIGRHQNPWHEINLQKCQGKDISICRRKSGGGTVYHDLGNINLTFFCNRNTYNRKENLDFIISSLETAYNLKLSRNKKDDILLDNTYKVSGTAAKLGLKNTYHHCTLLCNTDLNKLKGLLFNPFSGITTNATKSVPSQTKNLFDTDYSYNKVVDTLSSQYLEKYNREDIHSTCVTINPNVFPEVMKKTVELQSWEWTYAKSPKFSIHCNIVLSDGKSNKYSFEILKGVISKIHSNGINNQELYIILQNLVGVCFKLIDIKNTLKTKLTYEQNHKYLNLVLNAFKLIC